MYLNSKRWTWKNIRRRLTLTWDVFKSSIKRNSIKTIPGLTLTWDVFKLLLFNIYL